MPTTPNLSLPYLEAGQAQKHVTLNESLRLLDTVTQLAVAAVSASPPPEPEDGERHIVGVSPSGVFTGHADAVAAFQDGVWVFLSPRPGWRAWNAATEQLLVWDGAAWSAMSGGGGAGDVAGPAGATDRAIARYDGTTGKLLQDSQATIDDSGHITAVRYIASGAEQTGLALPFNDDGAGVGPIVDVERVSTSPTANDSLGRFNFSGRNDAADKVDYANVTAQIVSAADGAEEGQAYWQVIVAGVLATIATVRATGLSINGVLDLGDTGDTTLARAAAGRVTVEGETLIKSPDIHREVLLADQAAYDALDPPDGNTVYYVPEEA